QVNTFYHVKKVFDRVGSMLTIAHDLVHFQTGNNLPASAQYNFATTKSYWPHSDGGVDTLTAYSKCYTNPMNSFYNAANRTLCYGVNEDYPGFLMVQDPTVIHHEVGHAYVDIMLNQRNITYDGL